MHELRAPPGTASHLGFAVLLLAALAPEVPVLWVSPSPCWYPPGLAWLGLDPARCLYAQADDDATCLSTLETALKGGLAGVAECRTLSRLAARRLALAAKQGGSIGAFAPPCSSPHAGRFHRLCHPLDGLSGAGRAMAG